MGEDFLLVLVFLIAEEITCKSPRSILRIHRIHCIITRRGKEKKRMLIDTIALVLTIIGAINWLLVGVFQFDIVAWLFGGQGAILSRILYTIIGAAGVWCITLLFKNNRSTQHREVRCARFFVGSLCRPRFVDGGFEVVRHFTGQCKLALPR